MNKKILFAAISFFSISLSLGALAQKSGSICLTSSTFYSAYASIIHNGTEGPKVPFLWWKVNVTEGDTVTVYCRQGKEFEVMGSYKVADKPLPPPQKTLLLRSRLINNCPDQHQIIENAC